MATDTAVELLAAAGKRLYGHQWQSAIARDLGVHDRTVRRWAAGDSPPPAGLMGDLLRLVRERVGELDYLAVRLSDATAHVRQGPM